jgi:hypothetical protein
MCRFVLLESKRGSVVWPCVISNCASLAALTMQPAPAMHVKHTPRSSPNSSVVLLELVLFRCCSIGGVSLLLWTTVCCVPQSRDSGASASGYHYKSYSPSSPGRMPGHQ